MSEPKLSPNGKRVLAEISVNGRKMVAVIQLDQPDAAPWLVDLRGNDLLDWGWANDDWYFVRLGDQGMIEGVSMYVTRIVGISADGKTVRPIGLRTPGQHAEIVWTANDGSPRVLIATQKSVYLGVDFWPAVIEADLSTGRSSQILDPISGISAWYADITGLVRVGIGTDIRTGATRVMHRRSKGERFVTIDRSSAGEDRLLIVPQAFLPDGKTAVTYSNHEGFDWLYEVDMATFNFGKKLFGVAGYDIDRFYHNMTGDGVDGVGLTASRFRQVWTNPSLAAALAGLEKTLGKDRHPAVIGRSKDNKTLLVHVGGADQAGAYHVLDVATGKLELIAWQNERLKGERLSPVSTVRYKARDGLEIPAVLTLPRGRAPKNLPLIVMPHGGPYGVRDSESYDWWAQYMASLGYAVVQPNYRGSGGYGRKFQSAADGEWGARMQDDLNDAVAHLAGQGIADPKRVCVVGGSYGGYAAMRAAQRDGSMFRCAISFAGVSDLPAIKAHDRSFLYGKLSSAYWKEVAPDLVAVSPVNFPQQFSAPILLVHGAKDKRVPVSQSKKLADRLKAAGKPYHYVEQPEGDHHFSREEDRLQFLQEAGAFLRQHNPPD